MNPCHHIELDYSGKCFKCGFQAFTRCQACHGIDGHNEGCRGSGHILCECEDPKCPGGLEAHSRHEPGGWDRFTNYYGSQSPNMQKLIEVAKPFAKCHQPWGGISWHIVEFGPDGQQLTCVDKGLDLCNNCKLAAVIKEIEGK